MDTPIKSGETAVILLFCTTFSPFSAVIRWLYTVIQAGHAATAWKKSTDVLTLSKNRHAGAIAPGSIPGGVLYILAPREKGRK